MAQGVDPTGTDDAASDTLGGRDAADEDIDIAATALLDTLPQPAFIVDTGHRVVGWNREMEVLTGVERDAVLGDDDTAAFFSDDRTRTLADAVVDNPDSADDAFGADRSGRDQRAYEVEQTLENADGDTLHVHSVATPIEQAGDLVGVVQLVQDNTELVRRREAMAGLVDEVSDTAQALDDGSLGARVAYDDEHDVLDDEILDIVDAVNAIADSTQEMVSGLVDEVEDLSDAANRIADATIEVDREVTEQNESISNITDEMQSVSATMQEVAASADQVSGAADQARDAAAAGADASAGANDQMEDVVAATEGLVDTVADLSERMDEIDAVVDVIADVAEQTNMLALNANIEAARAGEAGDGFAVVADEVKELANETKANTEEISEQIATIREQTDATVQRTRETNQQVQAASNEIDATIDALDDVVDAVEEAATGISEVAEANDDQAVSIEEMTATANTVEESAQDVEARIGDITEQTVEQRDAIDAMVAHLDTLADDRALDDTVTEQARVETAADRVDEAATDD